MAAAAKHEIKLTMPRPTNHLTCPANFNLITRHYEPSAELSARFGPSLRRGSRCRCDAWQGVQLPHIQKQAPRKTALGRLCAGRYPANAARRNSKEVQGA